jgi:hypothetical protein
MTFRHPLSLAMAGFLTLSSLPARPSVLGAVSAAKHVHLNTTAVTVGATVYDGDRFSAETGGMLRLRSGTAGLELAEESVISVQNPANGAQGMEVELEKGTLAFRSERVVSLVVIAREASVRPASDTRTVAQITVTGPKELVIRARRGALQFSYRGETETLGEGKSYRVILDSAEENPEQSGRPGPIRWPKGFKIVIIGEAAAVVALGIYESREPESPDRP